MPYHLNEKTGNPNVCRTASCKAVHFQTKEEALAKKKEKDSPSLHKSAAAVKEELAKDEAVTEAKEEKQVSPKPALSDAKAKEIADAVADETREPVVKVNNDGSRTHSFPKKKKSKKAKVENLVHEAVYHLDRLSKAAPKHPLVKKTRKTLKKLKK